MKTTGTCRLCKRIDFLKKSHFIPNAIIKAAKKQTGFSVFNGTENTKSSQDLLKKHFCVLRVSNCFQIMKNTSWKKFTT